MKPAILEKSLFRHQMRTMKEYYLENQAPVPSVLVVFHEADYDGLTSEAIAKKFLVECGIVHETVPYDYNKDLALRLREAMDRLPAEVDIVKLIFVDITPQSDASIQAVKDFRSEHPGCSVDVIDHHTGFFDKVAAGEMDGVIDNYIGDTTHAACWHVWNSFFATGEVPLIVQLLEEHDRWEKAGVGVHSQENRFILQKAIRTYFDSVEATSFDNVHDPRGLAWDYLFGAIWVGEEGCFSYTTTPELDNSPKRAKNLLLCDSLFKKACDDAFAQYGAEKEKKAKRIRENGFEVIFEGETFIAMNSTSGDSTSFEALYDPSRHFGMMKFCYRKNVWDIRLYTTGDRVTLPIAKRYKGGVILKPADFP